MFPYTLCVLNNVCVKMFSSFLCFIYRAFFCVCVFCSSPEVSSEISIAFSASLPIDTCVYSMCC